MDMTHKVANAVAVLAASEMQGDRLLRLEFPRQDGPAHTVMLANRLVAEEKLSGDFRFTVQVLSDDACIPLSAVMGKMVTISLVRDDGTLRYFNGYVFAFQLVSTDGGFAFYEMVLKPWLAFLHLKQDCATFQHLTVLEICDKTFEHYLQRDFRHTVAEELPRLTLAVQYNESDHNHLHRRMEEAGLLYWYEHRYDGHTLWIAKDSRHAAPIDGAFTALPFQHEAGAMEHDGVHHWQPLRRTRPARIALGSYNFKHARPVWASNASILRQGAVPQLEIYESTGAYGFRDVQAGETLAQQRMHEMEAGGPEFTATGNARQAQPGRWFTLDGHFSGGYRRPERGAAALPDDRSQRRYLILSVHHQASNNYQTGNGAPSHYTNTLQCAHLTTPWRPKRGMSSKAVQIYGLQTGLVVGPKGEEIHTDEYGRIRVQFHWDRIGKQDEA
ncbi:MAG TPA: type VI secretion system tip protein TssI/VgrG, partial [Burkholderiaceae bacterium]